LIGAIAKRLRREGGLSVKQIAELKQVQRISLRGLLINGLKKCVLE
jgi:transcriptional regulator with XRE-family HTH domain